MYQFPFINSLTPGDMVASLNVIFKNMLVTDVISISAKISHQWMP